MSDMDTAYERLNRETECGHDHSRATRAVKSNGVACVYIQCCCCGERLKEVSKRDYDVDSLPAFDESLRSATRERNRRLRDEVFENAKQKQVADWWAGYNDYLNSAHWRRLRLSIVRRDGYRCQNCFDEVTEYTAHVHHTSYVGYQRVGYSFAFECVTLCQDCHARYHAKESRATYG